MDIDSQLLGLIKQIERQISAHLSWRVSKSELAASEQRGGREEGEKEPAMHVRIPYVSAIGSWQLPWGR